MLFNSIEFAVFLPVAFLLYWFVFDYALSKCKCQLRLQNLFIVAVSYVFYGWWDWRFLILIAFTSFCSWASGLLLIGAANCGSAVCSNGGETADNACTVTHRCKARLWITLNITINLLILGVFKYYDFFVTSFAGMFGANPDGLLLKVILPVGISFYTFQALSYSVDVYRGKLEPTRDIVAFFAYISFFPQLVAGPIERATNLLPQFLAKRNFDYSTATDGMRQILWGLFKKVVVADNCATYVDQVFSTYQTQSGSTLLLAAVMFTFQIYGDFSGYSDIAIGTSKLFGIRLMKNFNIPYFSRDIAEFWRRWHISLTTWFRDYVYIPLGGSRPEIPDGVWNRERYKKWIVVRNTFVIFLLSGMWHGANWTFIAWGAYHALLFLPLILTGRNRKYLTSVACVQQPDGTYRMKLLPSLRETGQMLLTFLLVVVGWIIFRASSINEAYNYMCCMADKSIAESPLMIVGLKRSLLSVALLLIVEWISRMHSHALDIAKWPVALRYVAYYLLIIIILELGGNSQSFIYFQF